jgi:hypothetical protein
MRVVLAFGLILMVAGVKVTLLNDIHLDPFYKPNLKVSSLCRDGPVVDHPRHTPDIKKLAQ